MPPTNDEDSKCDIVIELLKSMRKIDDNITTSLNANWDPKDARSTCAGIHDQLIQSYSSRDTLLKNCIAQSSERVRLSKEAHDAMPNDISALKTLRKEQTQLRLMQSELSVEQILRDQTLSIFNNRCRNYYKVTH